jgi:hypothetical protein
VKFWCRCARTLMRLTRCHRNTFSRNRMTDRVHNDAEMIQAMRRFVDRLAAAINQKISALAAMTTHVVRSSSVG